MPERWYLGTGTKWSRVHTLGAQVVIMYTFSRAPCILTVQMPSAYVPGPIHYYYVCFFFFFYLINTLSGWNSHETVLMRTTGKAGLAQIGTETIGLKFQGEQFLLDHEFIHFPEGKWLDYGYGCLETTKKCVHTGDWCPLYLTPCPNSGMGTWKKKCVHISTHWVPNSGTVPGHQVWTQPIVLGRNLKKKCLNQE